MKKIRKIRIHLIDDNTGEEGILSVQREFDENGRLTSDTRYYDGVNIEQRIEKKYDAAGLLLEEASFSESEEPDLRIRLDYDENGRLIRQETHYMAGNASIAHHDYDDVTRQETVKIVDDEGQLEEIHKVRKDAEDRILEEKITDHEGNVVHWITRSFEETGRPLSIVTNHQDGEKMTEIFNYEFDENGRLIYARIDDENERTYREEEFEYDEQGNRTEWRYEDQRRGRSGIERWDFDSKGNITRHLVLAVNERPMEEEIMTYDEDGNLMEREHITPQGISIQVYHYDFY